MWNGSEALWLTARRRTEACEESHVSLFFMGFSVFEEHSSPCNDTIMIFTQRDERVCHKISILSIFKDKNSSKSSV